MLKTQYVGGKSLKLVGKEIVVLEKHTKCKCDCKVKAEVRTYFWIFFLATSLLSSFIFRKASIDLMTNIVQI